MKLHLSSPDDKELEELELCQGGAPTGQEEQDEDEQCSRGYTLPRRSESSVAGNTAYIYIYTRSLHHSS